MADSTPPLFAEAADADVGRRLDRFLADQWPDYSRARISALIDAGAVMAEDRAQPLTPSAKVRAGDVFRMTPPPAAPATPAAEAVPLNVAFEDDALIVVEKPAGMTVHPAPGQETGTLVNALLAHCGDSLSGIGGVKRPGIVHRIDKATSGLLVVAKSDLAHQGLARQFADHSVERRYRAFVWGAPSPPTGRIEAAIERDPRDRKRMRARAGGPGKHAVTHYAVSDAFGVGAAEVVCRLETGRTHQIRVHMELIGWPLIGDPSYGRVTKARRARLAGAALDAAQAFPRQALHAATLGFVHPISGAALHFESPLPDDLTALRRALETAAAVTT